MTSSLPCSVYADKHPQPGLLPGQPLVPEPRSSPDGWQREGVNDGQLPRARHEFTILQSQGCSHSSTREHRGKVKSIKWIPEEMEAGEGGASRAILSLSPRSRLTEVQMTPGLHSH